MTPTLRPIGLIDSGMGGLTVAKELHSLLPHEDIIYLGDSANCPYGNKPKDEILALTHNMLKFLESKDVKMALVACNTISALFEEYCHAYPFPVVSIILPMAKTIAEMNINSVGLIATMFTVKMGRYDAEIKRLRQDIEVYSQGSQNLAGYVDSGQLDSPELIGEVSSLAAKFNGLELKHIILGCTHYPIVEHVFKKAAPSYVYLNPAKSQAKESMQILCEKDLMNPQETKGKCTVYTTGDASVCRDMLNILECRGFLIEEVSIL